VVFRAGQWRDAVLYSILRDDVASGTASADPQHPD
jgi:RimJ/RimL family protein N-acetyltransferase